MSISVFPTPAAAGAISESVTLTTAYTTYEGATDFPSGVYTISVSPITSNVQVIFFDSTGDSTTSGITTTGTLTIDVPSDSAGVLLTEQTGNSNVQVSIEKTANSLSGNGLSGTLDTITSTGTYNETGQLYVLVVGGGGGGGKVNNTSQGAAGGGGGGINPKLVYVNTSTSVTIGSAGTGANSGGFGNSGGATSFGNLVSANGGGGGGQGSSGNQIGVAGTPGNANGGRGADGGDAPHSGSANNFKYESIVSGTNGGGGGGGSVNQQNRGNGAGSGIGTGGAGGQGGGGAGTGQPGGNANGYGAGGGGGSAGGNNPTTGNGGSGSAGVVYVLRGF